MRCVVVLVPLVTLAISCAPIDREEPSAAARSSEAARVAPRDVVAPADTDAHAGDEGVVGAPDDDGVVGAPDDAPIAAPPPMTLTVLSSNIYCGGRFELGRCDGDITYDVADGFASLLQADSVGDEALIGMQEVSNRVDSNGPYPGTANHEAVRQVLEQWTGDAWNVAHWPQGLNGTSSGNAVYWKPSHIALVADLGSVDIETLESGYAVRFGGALFQTVPRDGHPGGNLIAMFSGKLTWNGAVLPGGALVTHADRVRESNVLNAWIEEQLADAPQAARVIAMDMNSDDREVDPPLFTSPTHDFWLEAGWDRGPTSLSTTNSGKRLDYLWLRDGTFVEGPRRSMDYGSDHRFLWADVTLP